MSDWTGQLVLVRRRVAEIGKKLKLKRQTAAQPGNETERPIESRIAAHEGGVDRRAGRRGTG